MISKSKMNVSQPKLLLGETEYASALYQYRVDIEGTKNAILITATSDVIDQLSDELVKSYAWNMMYGSFAANIRRLQGLLLHDIADPDKDDVIDNAFRWFWRQVEDESD